MLKTSPKHLMDAEYMLSRVRKLAVTFAPLNENSKSALCLLARVRGPRSRKANPECKIEQHMLSEGEPYVDIEYTNNEKDRLQTASMSEKEILTLIKEKCLVIETDEVLKKAGLSGIKLEVAADRDRYYAGDSKKIPIT